MAIVLRESLAECPDTGGRGEFIPLKRSCNLLAQFLRKHQQRLYTRQEYFQTLLFLSMVNLPALIPISADVSVSEGFICVRSINTPHSAVFLSKSNS